MIFLMVCYPKGPCTQIIYTLALKYSLYRYIGPKVYTIWVHGPLGLHKKRHGRLRMASSRSLSALFAENWPMSFTNVPMRRLACSNDQALLLRLKSFEAQDEQGLGLRVPEDPFGVIFDVSLDSFRQCFHGFKDFGFWVQAKASGLR